jgi:glycosyltransferase involved in cell wall biosynthesis
MDALIVHSQANRTRLEELFPDIARKTHVIPHGIWKVGPQKSRAAARVQLGIEPERPTILFFGTLRPNKGLDLLLRAIALLRHSFNPTPLLLIAGLPAKADGFTHYARLIRTLGVSDCVKAHIEYVHEAVMGDYFSAADVIALPYAPTFQAQSGILFDAYARALPVVATNAGGIGETIERDRTGIVVHEHAPDAFAAGLRSLLSDRDGRLRIVDRMRALADGEYSWCSVAGRTRALYDDLELRANSSRVAPEVHPSVPG